MKALASQADVLARIGTVAGAYDIDISTLHPYLGSLGPELAVRAIVSVRHTFDRIAVRTRAARARVLELVGAEQARRVERLAPDAAELDVELESEPDGSISASVGVSEARTLDTDCAHLLALGAGVLSIERVRGCAETLGGAPFAIVDRAWPVSPAIEAVGSSREHCAWTLTFPQRNANDSERGATRSRVLTVARELAVTAPQQHVIEGLHDVLAKDLDSDALLTLGRQDTTPTLSLRWRRVRWETVIRLMLGFYKQDPGRRLGELAGAFASEVHADAIELSLGPTEPPALRIVVAR